MPISCCCRSHKPSVVRVNVNNLLDSFQILCHCTSKSNSEENETQDFTALTEFTMFVWTDLDNQPQA